MPGLLIVRLGLGRLADILVGDATKTIGIGALRVNLNRLREVGDGLGKSTVCQIVDSPAVGVVGLVDLLETR